MILLLENELKGSQVTRLTSVRLCAEHFDQFGLPAFQSEVDTYGHVGIGREMCNSPTQPRKSVSGHRVSMQCSAAQGGYNHCCSYRYGKYYEEGGGLR